MYPEHDKMRAVQTESRCIGDFLTWLEQEADCQICDRETNEPVRLTVEQLLARYFEIDLEKVSQEKDEMYAELVAANESRSHG